VIIAQYTNRLGISALYESKSPATVAGIFNSDILESCQGLLAQGKNDFDVI
jgi:hypothetical protein